ncbi:MAG TPA: SUF system NifU family Fe-S cluster assembly protein [Candidatus Hydrogenedentes bacterium]|nr:SUF system NifU family Fe-S cluster assembly protein [Candidatus Hydrogenedentota bacterium]
MADEHALYQRILLEHSRRPRNFREMNDADLTAEGHNPLCGDKLRVYLKMDGEVISEAMFQGSGCAIFKAAASMMTAALEGKTRREACALSETFCNMIDSEPGDPVDIKRLGELVALAGVREYPVRRRCATLPWHTLRAAFETHGRTRSTA